MDEELWRLGWGVMCGVACDTFAVWSSFGLEANQPHGIQIACAAMMATPKPDLAQLLANASADDQATVASWLEDRARGRAAADESPSIIAGGFHPPATMSRDEGRQLVKFRLAMSEYVQFQAWCQQNRLTMAQALRGLVATVIDRAENE